MKLVLALLVLAGTARADVWKRATEPEPQLDIYEALMVKGDEAAIAANAKGINIRRIIDNVDIAVEAYRGAAKARPKASEPYFRVASVLNSFYFDCQDYNIGNVARTCHATLQTEQRARDTLDAWDKFESLAPLDPRVNEVLLARAILRTKLVATTKSNTRPLLESAARDYQAMINRQDGMYFLQLSTVLGNLAETHMMLGNIDEAIAAYRDAIRAGGTTSTIYGLAVAFDRDERAETALGVIRAQGFAALESFHKDFERGQIFFVPAGEEEYYFGLAYEAFGHVDEAMDHWRAYLKSGAHPKFQPRAKDHLEKLATQKKLRWRAPITPDLEDRKLAPIRFRKTP